MLNLTHSCLNCFPRLSVSWEIASISLHSPQKKGHIKKTFSWCWCYCKWIKIHDNRMNQCRSKLRPHPCKMEMTWFMPGKLSLQHTLGTLVQSGATLCLSWCRGRLETEAHGFLMGENLESCHLTKELRN